MSGGFWPKPVNSKSAPAKSKLAANFIITRPLSGTAKAGNRKTQTPMPLKEIAARYEPNHKTFNLLQLLRSRQCKDSPKCRPGTPKMHLEVLVKDNILHSATRSQCSMR